MSDRDVECLRCGAIEIDCECTAGFQANPYERIRELEAQSRKREEVWRNHVTDLQSRILTLEQNGYVPELEARAEAAEAEVARLKERNSCAACQDENIWINFDQLETPLK